MDGSITDPLTANTEAKKPKTSYVSRVSELDYFLEICRSALKLKQLTKKDISEAIIKKRLELERTRPIYSSTRVSLPVLEGRISRGYLREGAIKDTIKLCLKWNLLTSAQMKDTYTPTNDCVRIGEYLDKNDLNAAKLELFSTIIKSGSERLFDPQNFLLKIRNSTVTSVIPFVTLSRKSNGKEKKIIKLPPIAVQECEGMAYNDYAFTYDVLNTNPVSLSVIFDWGDYFRLINITYPEIDLKDIIRQVKDFQEKEPGWKITGVYPTKGAYLCKIIVSFDELINLMHCLNAHGRACDVDIIKDELKITNYVNTCLIYTAQKLGLVKIRDNKVEADKYVTDFERLFDLTLNAQCLILSDGELTRGIVRSYTQGLDPRTTYIVSEPEWSLKTFLKALWVRYYELVEGKTFLYASIPRLREKVCKDLRIHNEVFDEYLNRCRLEYPDYISLSLGSAEIKSRLKIKRLEKAFMLHGRSYYLIKVKGYPD